MDQLEEFCTSDRWLSSCVRAPAASCSGTRHDHQAKAFGIAAPERSGSGTKKRPAPEFLGVFSRKAGSGGNDRAARLAARSTLVLQLSEIRLVTSRDCGVFFGAVFMWVFSTDILGPLAEYAPVGFGRGPNGCEDALVLDREVEL
jgi:hypothetical protein